METTRVNAAQMNIHGISSGPDTGIGYNFYQGPLITTGAIPDYFSSFNVDKQGINPLELAKFMKNLSPKEREKIMKKGDEYENLISGKL